MNNLSDERLWKLLKEGDLNAFGILFKSFYSLLYGYGLKISNNKDVTEDALQDFFLYVFEHRKNLSDLNSITPYLVSSFRRFIIKKIVKDKKQIMVRDIDTNVVDINFTQEEFMILQESINFKNRNLAKLVNKLPKRQKEVIYLKYNCNLKAQEIAETLEINYQSVINTLHKAIKNLREEVAILKLLNI